MDNLNLTKTTDLLKFSDKDCVKNLFSTWKAWSQLWPAKSTRLQIEQEQIQALKLQNLGTLMASITHEINNPLSAMKGYCYQIREELKKIPDYPSAITQEIEMANERVMFNLQRVSKITQNLRTYSRDTKNDDFGPVSVKDIFEDVLSLMETNIRSVGIHFEVESPEEDAFVWGHLVELSQILINLLSNARDAVMDQKQKHIQLGYSVSKEIVQIWVRDSGLGVDAKNEGKLFKKFFSTKALGHGTGLGLSISQMLAHKHQSSIVYRTLKSPTGHVQGAEFSIRLALYHLESSQKAA